MGWFEQYLRGKMAQGSPPLYSIELVGAGTGWIALPCWMGGQAEKRRCGASPAQNRCSVVWQAACRPPRPQWRASSAVVVQVGIISLQAREEHAQPMIPLATDPCDVGGKQM